MSGELFSDGPWNAVEGTVDEWVVYDEHHRQICTVENNNMEPAEVEANADLVAAGPALFAECFESLYALDTLSCMRPLTDAEKAMQDKLGQLIRKARGEQ